MARKARMGPREMGYRYDAIVSGPTIYLYATGNPVRLYDRSGRLPQGFVDFSAGVGDSLLLGQGQRLRDLLGIDGGVSTCSASYDVGMAVGIVGSLGDGEGEAALVARLVDSEGELRVTQTVAAQLAADKSFIPVNAILETVAGGARTADPQGVANFFMYTSEASFNGSAGRILEVLVDEENAIIAHVLYK